MSGNENARCDYQVAAHRRFVSNGPLAVVSDSPMFSGHMASYPQLETIDRGKLEQAIRHHFHFDGTAGHQDVEDQPCNRTVHFSEMLSALLEKDPKYFRALLDRLRAERVPLLVICETLIVPVANELGRMWCEDEESFSSVTAASSRLQILLNSLSDTDGPSFCDSERPRILLMRMPSNDHTLGLSVIASVFHEEGWSVDGGPGLAAGNRAYAMARDGGYKVIGLSVTVGSSTEEIAAIIRKIRAACPDPETAILIGGPSLAHREEELRAAGADILALDVRQAIQTANARIKRED